MGMVELPNSVIIELGLRINKNSTNMRTKVLTEAKLVEQIDRNNCGDFDGLVRSSDFV